MPKPRSNELVQGRYFRWLLGKRDGIYVADGRSNTPKLGRYSLETGQKDEALRALQELDLTMAVRHGLASPDLLKSDRSQLLPLTEGRKLYERYVGRPAVANGPKPATAKRYRAVLDKFVQHCAQNRVRYWNEVNRELFDGYAAWLDDESYAYATEYLELTTLKQILKYLVSIERLPASALFPYPMRKPTGTDTYCWTPQEVAAILKQCETPELAWLRSLTLTLAYTGMRISELAQLRWSDIDLQRRMITIRDESTSRSSAGRERRTTKSGHSRTFPIHPDLATSLEAMDHHPDGVVFHGPLGGKIKPDKVRRSLIRDALTPLAPQFPKDGDEPGFIDGRLHSFRHYFCSTCANAGIPERVLMDWLGHRSSKMVHRYYHLHDQESHRQMARLATLGSSDPGSG